MKKNIVLLLLLIAVSLKAQTDYITSPEIIDVFPTPMGEPLAYKPYKRISYPNTGPEIRIISYFGIDTSAYDTLSTDIHTGIAYISTADVSYVENIEGGNLELIQNGSISYILKFRDFSHWAENWFGYKPCFENEYLNIYYDCTCHWGYSWGIAVVDTLGNSTIDRYQFSFDNTGPIASKPYPPPEILLTEIPSIISLYITDPSAYLFPAGPGDTCSSVCCVFLLTDDP